MKEKNVRVKHFFLLTVDFFCALMKPTEQKEPTTMNKAIAYIRVSTLKQVKEGESLEVQEEKLRSYCKANDLELFEVIKDEGISASVPFKKRPGGKKCLQLVGGSIKHIVVLKFDRIFRNTVDALQMIEKFEDIDVHLHALDFAGMTIRTDNAMGKFIVTLRAGLNELERGITRERTIEAMQERKRKGQFTGAIPFGYEVSEDQRLQEKPWRPAAIKTIHRMRAAGKSFRIIADTISHDHEKVSHQTIKRLLEGRPVKS